MDDRVEDEPTRDRVGSQEQKLAGEELLGYFGVCDVAVDSGESTAGSGGVCEALEHIDLFCADVRVGRPDDAGQVDVLDDVVVDDCEVADAEVRELLYEDRPAAVGTDDANMGLAEELLTSSAEKGVLADRSGLRSSPMPGVAP